MYVSVVFVSIMHLAPLHRVRGMFGSTYEMHFLNYESQKGKKKKSQKWDIIRN